MDYAEIGKSKFFLFNAGNHIVILELNSAHIIEK